MTTATPSPLPSSVEPLADLDASRRIPHPRHLRLVESEVHPGRTLPSPAPALAPRSPAQTQPLTASTLKASTVNKAQSTRTAPALRAPVANKTGLALPTPSLVQRIKSKTQSGVSWVSHASLGGALTFMENAGRVLAPVFFVGRHSATVVQAALLLGLPGATTAVIWHRVPELAHHFQGVPAGAYLTGLYVATSFLWLMAGLLTVQLCKGIGRGLARFADKGAQTFS